MHARLARLSGAAALPLPTPCHLHDLVADSSARMGLVMPRLCRVQARAVDDSCVELFVIGHG